MAQRDAAGSIQGLALRLARLAADGSTPAGVGNMYVTDTLVSLSVAPEVEEGEEIVAKNASGGLCFSYKDKDRIKRVNLELSICNPDPEIHELLVGGSLISQTGFTVTDGQLDGTTTVVSSSAAFSAADVGLGISGTGIPAGATIVSVTNATTVVISAAATATATGVAITIARLFAGGYAYPAIGVASTSSGVSLELWSRAVVGGAPAAQFPYFWWALPHTEWQLGERTFENGALTVNFTGFGIENHAWGNGPANDWGNDVSNRAVQYKRATTLPTTQLGSIATPTQV